jgi:hypothetical protein
LSRGILPGRVKSELLKINGGQELEGVRGRNVGDAAFFKDDPGSPLHNGSL